MLAHVCQLLFVASHPQAFDVDGEKQGRLFWTWRNSYPSTLSRTGFSHFSCAFSFPEESSKRMPWSHRISYLVPTFRLSVGRQSLPELRGLFFSQIKEVKDLRHANLRVSGNCVIRFSCHTQKVSACIQETLLQPSEKLELLVPRRRPGKLRHHPRSLLSKQLLLESSECNKWQSSINDAS